VRTLLLIASEPIEFIGLLRHAPASIQLPLPVDYARGVEIGERRCLLVANGPGPKLSGAAARAALGTQPVDAVISTGFCGGLDPELAAGAVVSADCVVDSATGERFEARPAADFPQVAMACCDRVVQTAQEKRLLRERTGAAAVDMESAAVAREARHGGIPFYCVRVITDTAHETFANDFNASRGSDGRFSRRSVVVRALARPWPRLSELFRLARTGRRASRTLGDALVTARF
jgi:adenosylhomocysteine nucleosidase